MQKTVLLTGAAGFIGSHVAEAYLSEGFRVVGVDDLSSGTRENMAVCEKSADFIFREGSICDRGFVAGLMQEYRPQLINHHAAQKSVPASVEDPFLDADINIMGLLNLVMACEASPIEQFIFASTGGAMAAAPVGERLPDETDKPQLQSPYAITKFASEQYIACYGALFGFDYTALRYGNVYGPRQIPAGECGVIPIFVENALANRPSTLFAYPDMPDGCTRDYVHVYDVVAANLAATRTPANTAINIATGTELSIGHIYRALMTALNKNLPLQTAGPRPGDLRRSVISPALAKQLLGWEAKIGLEEGLATLA